MSEGLTTIGNSAFYNCSSLESIEVASANAEYSAIGNCLIDKKDKILIQGCKNSVIPADGSVEYIGEYAFAFIFGVGARQDAEIAEPASLAIPVDVIYGIGFSAFDGCVDLVRIDVLSNKDDLSGFFALELANEKANPLCNGADLYFNDALVTDIVLPESIKTVKSWVLYGCRSLQSIVVHSDIEMIGEAILGECDSLVNIFFEGRETDIYALMFGGNIGKNNDNLLPLIRFYSEEAPEDRFGSFWHYVEEVPTVWVDPLPDPSSPDIFL